MKNKILILIATVLCFTFVACSSDDVLENVIVGETGEGTEGVIHDMEFADASRSSLTLEGSSMKFAWNAGDEIAVYPVWVDGVNQEFDEGENPRTVLTYIVQTRETDESVTGSFGQEGEKVILSQKNTEEYLAWSPFFNVPGRVAPEEGCGELPVTYEGQTQVANVKIGYKGGDDDDKYKESEAVASSHLGAYDYLYAQAEQQKTGYTCFDFHHLQATIRFYMQVPEPDKIQVFDSLMIMHTFSTHAAEYKFTTKGTFDLNTQTFTPTKQPNTVVLKLGENGFDLRDYNEDTGEYSDTYSDQYKRNNKYYIIAYMELYPLTLIHDDILMPTLYLCGHTGSGDNLKKNYYKARLVKKNILAGKLYQWTTTPDEEEPITFEVISVQQWEAETGYNNGDEGTGTNNW